MKELSRGKLKEIYEKNSVGKACKILNISSVTLNKYLRLAGIPLKGKGNRTPKSKFKITLDV